MPAEPSSRPISTRAAPIAEAMPTVLVVTPSSTKPTDASAAADSSAENPSDFIPAAASWAERSAALKLSAMRAAEVWIAARRFERPRSVARRQTLSQLLGFRQALRSLAFSFIASKILRSRSGACDSFGNPFQSRRLSVTPAKLPLHSVPAPRSSGG